MGRLFGGLNPLSQEAVLDVDIPDLEKVPGERKVSRAFYLPDGNIDIIDTDIIGAFDQPHRKENGEPAHYASKGWITAEFNRWFKDWASELIPTDHVPLNLEHLQLIPEKYHYRATIHRPAKPMPIEFITRGTLEGSAVGKSSICGQDIPKNIQLGQMLPRPYFTPTTKAPKGEKDKDVTLEQYYDIVGDQAIGNYLYGATVLLYLKNRVLAKEKGEDRPDQKNEFGYFINPGTATITPEPRSKIAWAELFTYLCKVSGFSPSAWETLPMFDFDLFCIYAEENRIEQTVGVIDAGGGTDDGRYRDLKDTITGERLYAMGSPAQARVYMTNYNCKEYFRTYSKSTNDGGYGKPAGQIVVVPDSVLNETGQRNLRVLLKILG